VLTALVILTFDGVLVKEVKEDVSTGRVTVE
jgi:hypothetical protein